MTVDEAFLHARRRLPGILFDRLADGNPHTYPENTRVFDDVLFRPRAATVYEVRDLTTTVLGTRISLPVILGCPGSARIFHPGGEVAATVAAGRAGTINVAAMATGHPLEDVAAVATRPLWQQLYMARGREGAEELIDRAKAAGFEALVVTVDAPLSPVPVVPGMKVSGLMPPLKELVKLGPPALLRPRWLFSYLVDTSRQRNIPEMEKLGIVPGAGPARLRTGELGNKFAATWDDFSWISDLWGGPIVVKGVLSGDDARRARDVGASAVIVSNHGAIGTLDDFPSSLRMLPEVVSAVDGDCEVLLDSGIRNGAHVVKALALGARAVLIGRPWLAGLAAGGEEGVFRILEVLRHEIDRVLGGLGCPSVTALDRSFVHSPPEWSPGS